MALQIIRQPDDIGDLLSRLGRGLGTGIGSGLEKMAQSKLNQMQKRQQMAQLQEAGVSPSLANFIAGAPPKAQADLYSRLQGLGGAQQGQQQFPGMVEETSGMVGGAEAGQPGIGQAAQPGVPQVTLGAPLADRRHQDLIKQHQFSNQLAIDAANKSYIDRSSNLQTFNTSIQDDVNTALDLVRNDKVTLGPIAGRIPGVFDADIKLDNALDNILLETDALERVPGERSSIMRLMLKQKAKPSRILYKNTLIERLEKIQKKGSEFKKENEIIAQVISANNGKQPRDIRAKVQEIHKVYKRLPSTEEYKEGDIGQEGPYEFMKQGDDWVYIGRVS